MLASTGGFDFKLFCSLPRTAATAEYGASVMQTGGPRRNRMGEISCP